MKAVALAAVAGLATAASAQVTLNITADVTSVGYGGLITWTVTASFADPGGAYLFGYDLSFIASDATLGTASPFATALSNAIGPTAGTAAGANLNGASGGQSSLIGGIVAPGSPVTLGSFTVVAGNVSGFLSYTTTDGGRLASTTQLSTKQGSDFGLTLSNGAPNIINSTNVEIVPTPATAALLGLGGLVAARRRR